MYKYRLFSFTQVHNCQSKMECHSNASRKVNQNFKAEISICITSLIDSYFQLKDISTVSFTRVIRLWNN